MRESVNNTTVLPLLNGDTFSGIWERGIFPEIMVSCICDSSAILYFDFSVDGKNYTTEPPTGFTVTSDDTLVKTAIKGLRWFRIRLVAGGTQTYLRLYTYYGTFNQLWLSTSELQEAGNDLLASIDTKLTNPIPVIGDVSTDGLTNTQLRATPVPVLDTNSAAIKTALEVIDNFISGARGLVTEDNSLATKTAVEAINLVQGAIADAIVAAGATGSISAKLRRATQGIEDLKTLIVLGVGTNVIGKVSIDQTTPGTTNLVALAAETTKVIGTVFSQEPNVLFKGRACTFRTLGRAGTTGQKLLSIHNATGSAVTVMVKNIIIDMWCTVVKVITVAPPIVRIWKVTVLPTNGTALAKTKIGGTTTSNASVTILGDASADGTGSGTTLTATLPAGTFIEQQTAPRFITAAGYEMADSMEFLRDTEITLAPLEGIVVFLDYTLATQNPVTDMWMATVEWREK